MYVIVYSLLVTVNSWPSENCVYYKPIRHAQTVAKDNEICQFVEFVFANDSPEFPLNIWCENRMMG